MRLLKTLTLFSGILLNTLQASATNDLCSEATPLCANIGLISTNVGATATAGDVLNCGDQTVSNNLWFTVQAITAGPVNITVYNINNPGGLEMEVFTGACGSLVSTGLCATGSPSTAGRMTIPLTTVAGTLYYIMVDGGNGNAESFGIIASTSAANIVGRPNSNFNTSPTFGCAPLAVTLENTTVLQGGSNISYEWQIDNGSYLPASGADTTVVIGTTGMHTLSLRVCNTECGCKIVSQDVLVQELTGSIIAAPAGICTGDVFDFEGVAVVQPDPPFSDPGVTDWLWNFGDPASGADSIASGQFVSHTFSGNQNVYTVTLTIVGACSTTTVTQQVTTDAPPQLSTNGASTACLDGSAELNASMSGNAPPFTYAWSGPSAIDCANCGSTTASGWSTSGDFEFTVTATDANGCSLSDTVTVHVFPLPEVSATPSYLVCRGDSVNLTATVSGGTGPYVFAWSPAQGLSDPASPSPSFAAWSDQTVCVTVTDSNNCASAPSCSDIQLHPSPTVTPDQLLVCVTESNPQNTFTVTGAGTGSLFSWYLSPDFQFITSANADSSAVTASFPSGIATTYAFTVVVIDGITGCHDTLPVSCSTINNVNLAVSGPSDVCLGDSVTLTATGANSFTWTAAPYYAFADSSAAAQTLAADTSMLITITGVSGACSQTISRPLIVHPRPDVQISSLPDFCTCDTIVLSADISVSNAIVFWNGSAPILDPSAATTSAYSCGTASFMVSVTDPMTGCSATDSATAFSHPLPAAFASVTPEQICQGAASNVLLNGTGSDTSSGTTYSWNTISPGVTIVNASNLLGSAVVSDVTVFTLTVTDRFGCDSTASDTVNLYTPPSVSVSSAYICSSDTSTTSTLTVNGAAEGSFITWILNDPCVFQTSTGDSTATFEFGSCGTGTYLVDVSVIDAITGCRTELSTSVELLDSVSLTVTPDTSVCEGDAVILQAAGANTYVWSTGDTTQTIVLTGLTSVNSPYSFTVTGSAGLCSTGRTTSVSILPLPPPLSVYGPDTVCQNSSGNLYYAIPSGGNYAWNVVGGTILSGQGTDSLLVDWGISGPGRVSVSGTNSNGCGSGANIMDVTIVPRPVPATNINGPYRVCAGSTITYLVLPLPGSAYTWSVSGGTVTGGLTADSIQVMWPDTGTGQITVYETNAAGCTGPVTVLPVTIHEIPSAPTLTGPDALCEGASAIYSTVPVSGSVFNWQTNGGVISGLNTFYDSISVLWTVPGVHLLYVSETNAWGCTGPSTSDSITIHQQPAVSIADDSLSACQGTPFTLSAVSSFGDILWNSTGAGILDNPSTINPVYTPASSDTGAIVLTVTASGIGCPDDTDQVVITWNPIPQVQVSLTSDSICEGALDTVSASGGGAYWWMPAGISDPFIIVQPSVTTSYTVIVTGNGGCTSTGIATVFVDPAAVADAGADQSICGGDTVLLSGTQQYGTGAVWTTNGDGLFVPSNLSLNSGYLPGPTDLSAGTVSLFLTTTGACMNDRDTMTLLLTAVPTVYAGPDTSIVTVEVVNIEIPLNASVTGATGVQWSTSGSGTFVPDNSTLQAVYVPGREDLEADSVILTLTSADGCIQVSDQLVIEFIPFIIPNVITPYPGSPGMNDYFEIRHLPDNSALTLFDRWGITVFESTDYRNNWDAANLNSDTYFYVLKVGKRDFHGWLRVIREDR